jgi:hypothetical protein
VADILLGSPLGQHFEQLSNVRDVYETFDELSEKVHNALYALYSPDSEVTGRALIALYNEYIQWYDTIPENPRLGDNYALAVLFAQSHRYEVIE